MKKREAATVRCEPAPQIVPAVDLMHRLVSDEFLEYGGRRLPVDSTQFEKAAIEP